VIEIYPIEDYQHNFTIRIDWTGTKEVNINLPITILVDTIEDYD
jgi:hypothetical protein